MQIVLDGVSAFDPHQRREFLLLMSAPDVRHRKCRHHAIWMPRRLFVYGINQVKSMLREYALIRFRLNPDGKEFGAQIAGLGFVEADVSDVFRGTVADIEAFIQKPLRGVRMRVHDDCGVVDGVSARTDWVASPAMFCAVPRGERQESTMRTASGETMAQYGARRREIVICLFK